MASRVFTFSRPVLQEDGKTILWKPETGYIPATTEEQFFRKLQVFLGKGAIQVGEHGFVCRSVHYETIRPIGFGVIPMEYLPPNLWVQEDA